MNLFQDLHSFVFCICHLDFRRDPLKIYSLNFKCNGFLSIVRNNRHITLSSSRRRVRFTNPAKCIVALSRRSTIYKYNPPRLRHPSRGEYAPIQYELMSHPFLASTSSNSSDIYFIMLIAVIDNFSDVFTKVSTKITAMDAQHQIDLFHRCEILKNNMKIIMRNSWHASDIFTL